MMGVASLFRYVCSLVMPEGLVGLGWASESLYLYKYALGSHSEAKMCLFVCARVYVRACLHDATAAKRARGYCWPAGLLWRPVVSG